MRYLILIFCLGSVLAAEIGPPIQKDYAVDEVAPQVFVIHGPMGVPSPENQGFMNNPAFILTEKGVIVVDPGGSLQIGQMVLQKIKQKTDLPVIAIFNTHVHGDHWLGNQAIRQTYPQVKIYGHQNMLTAIDQGVGEDWVELMLRATQGATAGTRVEAPNQALKGGETIHLSGLDFVILHEEQAHTTTDIMIYIPQKKLLFLGDNGSNQRMVRLNDASIQGNIRALDQALQSGAKYFVPGHGRSADAQMVKNYRLYLNTLYQGVQKYYEQDLADFEIKPLLLPKLQAWQHWVDFDDLVGSHISIAYLEIEAEDFH